MPKDISDQETRGYARQFGGQVRNGDSQMALEAFLGRIQTNKLGLELTVDTNRKIIRAASEIVRNPNL